MPVETETRLRKRAVKKTGSQTPRIPVYSVGRITFFDYTPLSGGLSSLLHHQMFGHEVADDHGHLHLGLYEAPRVGKEHEIRTARFRGPGISERTDLGRSGHHEGGPAGLVHQKRFYTSQEKTQGFLRIKDL